VLEILRLWGEDHIDGTGGAYHSVADERDASDEHIANARTIEIIENLAKASHLKALEDAASSIARVLREMPSASSSSGSRDPSRMSR